MSSTVAGRCAEALWRLGYTGRGVTVAHLDTGVAGNHPALHGKVAAFRFFDDLGEEVATERPIDSRTHGTHTAGIVCGGEIDGHPIGLAPEARLYSAAVINSGHNLVRILRAMAWVRRSQARILLLAFGTSSPNPVLFPMIESLRRRGVLVIAPIGNHGKGRSAAPGCYSNVFSVGAIGCDGRVPYFSGSWQRRGRCLCPQVLAPGEDVLSADARSPGLRAVSGTSQAGAFAAGLAALLLQARTDATIGQIAHALAAGCRVLRGAAASRSRYGSLDPLGALDALSAAPADASLPPLLRPETARYVDPVLRGALRTNSGTPLTCVIVVARGVADDHEHGAPGVAVARVAKRMNEKVERMVSFRPARTGVVTGSARFVGALIDSRLVSVASAPRITANPFA